MHFSETSSCAKPNPLRSTRRWNQIITTFVWVLRNWAVFFFCFCSVGINSKWNLSITLFRAEWQLSGGGEEWRRGMIDGIALTNTGAGRRFTVAVLSTLTILLPPHHCFNPSHTQMSQRPVHTHTHTHSTYNTHVHCRVRLGYDTLTFARQEGAVNDKGGRHEWLGDSSLWLPLRHPLDWRRIDGDICLPELSFFFIEVRITRPLNGGSSGGRASQPVHAVCWGGSLLRPFRSRVLRFPPCFCYMCLGHAGTTSWISPWPRTKSSLQCGGTTGVVLQGFKERRRKESDHYTTIYPRNKEIRSCDVSY